MLEARDRVGGRVHSRTLANGAVDRDGRRVHPPGHTPRSSGSPTSSASGSGTRACATASASRAASGSPSRRARGRRGGRRGARGRRRAGRRTRPRAARLADDRRRRRGGDPRPRRGLRGRAGRLRPGGRDGAAGPGQRQPAPGVAGGNQGLAEALADAVGRERINLGDPVRAIADEGDGVVVATDAGRSAPTAA